jgi:hypothetical protein
MKTVIELKLDPSERTAMRSLTQEEREAVVDELLIQVRENLVCELALEVARDPLGSPAVTPRRAGRLTSVR